jgi:hypothetical protein
LNGVIAKLDDLADLSVTTLLLYPSFRTTGVRSASSCRPVMPIGDHAWRSIQLDDLIGGGVTKTTGSEAAIDVEAFGARIMPVR